jgi:hypothetical protein
MYVNPEGRKLMRTREILESDEKKKLYFRENLNRYGFDAVRIK